MRALATRRNGLLGLLAALCLLVVAMVPVFDTAVCSGDEGQAVAAAGLADDGAPAFHAQPDEPAGHHGAQPDACIHGHCHHAAAAVPAASPPLGRHIALREALHPGLRAMPPSAGVAPPTHPPRA